MKLFGGPEYHELWGSLNMGVVRPERVDETPIPTALVFFLFLLP